MADPAPPSPPGALARLIAAWIKALTASRRRSAAALVFALALGALALVYGLGIEVDTDLRALLPESAPSVEALDALEGRMQGASERFIVGVEAPTTEDAEHLAEGLAAEIGSWPETESVSLTRDYTPLRDHALYFLELDELEELRDELGAQRKQAIARTMGPGLTDDPVDIEAVSVGNGWDDQGAGLDWDADPEDAGEPPAEAKTEAGQPDFQRFLDEQRAALIERSELDPREVALIWPEENDAGEIEWREHVGQDYANEAGTIRTIQASLTEPATDVGFAQDVVARVQRRAEALRAEGVDEQARVEVIGAYNVSREVDAILRDARRATWISASLVVTVLLIGFRKLRAVLLVLVPMSVATGLTLAATRLTYGELNALTVFLFAVLFGMGVDFSVHLFAQRQRQGAVADWPAVIAAHFRPLASTMLTTAGSLAVLALAEFQAFREFGVISAIGVVLCFVAAITLVPALDHLLGPLRRLQPGEASSDDAPAGAPAPAPAPAAPDARRRLGPLALIRGALLTALVGVSLVGAPQLRMEKDTRALKAKRPADAKAPIAYGSTVGRCSKPLTLVAEDPAELELVVDRVLDERGALLPGAIDTGEPREPWIREVYSLETMMPEQQAAKAEVLAEIAARTNDFLAELPDLDAEAQRQRSHLEALERLAKADPLRLDELPDWALEPFRESDGEVDRLAHVCIYIASYHIDELVAVRARLDELTAGTQVRAADSRLVFADLMVLVERDARRLPIIALAVILAFIALDQRRLGATLACFATLTLGLGTAVAFMGLWPLHLNFFNLVVMPAVVGLGIDASIHLWHARTRPNLGATGRASLIAALTTVAGFSGLLAAEHAGLRSIGEVGVAAILICVGVAFLALYPIRRGR
ncbi:MMPL family transporter [Pseudenhygromyxa sp. WMMC2535]|uniref:MMPL family transporter n=1 Tax=Pseudenhygromyxa sp. WMMC2535 TaxID=2712867 RepID=UPI0015570A21|nr:MMPL family transporter [Pseudenhygromyxa sp. WMMC2535]NVB40924.1 MMPL family transporter [Pseudenhygromyxa sp. WMMC2535]